MNGESKIKGGVRFAQYFKAIEYDLSELHKDAISTFEIAWVILQAYYLSSQEKITVYSVSDSQINQFDFNFSVDSTITQFIEQYFSCKKHSVVCRQEEIKSNNSSLLFFNTINMAEFCSNKTRGFLLACRLKNGCIEIGYHDQYHNDSSIGACMALFKHIFSFILSRSYETIRDLLKTACVSSDIKPYMCPSPRNISAKDVLSVIETCCKNEGEHLAIVDSEHKITYAETLSYFKSLSTYLRSVGINSGCRVGLYLSRSYKFIISILALLDLEVSFVPIDSNMPEDRVCYIINDSKMVALLSDGDFSYPVPTPVINLNCHPDIDAIKKHINPDIYCKDILEEAYLIYTSGSTGLPKGVSISRDSLNFYVNTAKQLYAIAPSDTVLQFASIAFDAMIEEVIPTLAAGATIVLRNDNDIPSIENLVSIIDIHRITILNFPTSYWRLVLNSSDIDCIMPKSVRLVIIGGESASLEQLQLWKGYFPCKPKLMNTYGPTEATVIVSTFDVTDNTLYMNSPIGQPIPGSIIVILDQFGNVCPEGVIGELYIGGPSVAIGYTNTEMNHRFKELVLNNVNFGRFYQSGDFGRYSIDGNIDFIGRKDSQVKISGYRINLDEIEQQIHSASEHVREAVVRVIKLSDKELGKIVAFIRLDSCQDGADLENKLINILPNYMLPKLMFLESIPKTVSGKPDIEALKKLYTQTPYELAVTEDLTLTQHILNIWQRMLNASVEDVNKPFCEYGGSSIDTIIMTNCINSAFDIKLSLNDYNRDDLTVSALVKHIEKLRNNSLTTQDNIEKNDKPPSNFLDWRNDKAYVDFTINAQLVTKPRECSTTDIFITGATGFLGIHILKDLLECTSISSVHCLIRADNLNVAMKKLQDKAIAYDLNIDFCSSKLFLLCGDASKNQFGLPKKIYSSISSINFDIINCAANVNMFSKYEDLEDDNVVSLKKLIEFSSTKTAKTIHHISSLVIFDSPELAADVDEYLSIDMLGDLPNGYSQSKWVAEKVLHNAREVGVQSNIYRLGRVWGSKLTGIMPKNDVIWRFIKGCVLVGCVPDIEVELDVMPVCTISKTIVQVIINQSRQLNRNFHLCNPEPIYLSDIFRSLFKGEVVSDVLNYEVWVKTMLSQIKENPQNHPFSSIAFLLGHESHTNWVDSYISTIHTLEYLQSMGISYQHFDKSYFTKYFNSDPEILEKFMTASYLLREEAG